MPQVLRGTSPGFILSSTRDGIKEIFFYKATLSFCLVSIMLQGQVVICNRGKDSWMLVAGVEG
jgi:hypothetical protein